MLENSSAGKGAESLLSPPPRGGWLGRGGVLFLPRCNSLVGRQPLSGRLLDRDLQPHHVSDRPSYQLPPIGNRAVNDSDLCHVGSRGYGEGVLAQQ